MIICESTCRPFSFKKHYFGAGSNFHSQLSSKTVNSIVMLTGTYCDFLSRL